MDAILVEEMPGRGWPFCSSISRSLRMAGSHRGSCIRWLEVLLLLTCATMAGCDDFDDIIASGENHLDFLRRFSPFHFGIPCVRS